jgi:hypothetical protein
MFAGIRAVPAIRIPTISIEVPWGISLSPREAAAVQPSVVHDGYRTRSLSFGEIIRVFAAMWAYFMIVQIAVHFFSPGREAAHQTGIRCVVGCEKGF